MVDSGVLHLASRLPRADGVHGLAFEDKYRGLELVFTIWTGCSSAVEFDDAVLTSS